MKKLILLFVLVSSFTMAQNEIIVTEEMAAIDGTSRNSLTVMMEGARADDVKKAWKKRLKDLKGKVNDKTIIFGDDCKTKEMGENTFDVYSIVEEVTEEMVRLVVAIDLGGAYLNTEDHPDKLPVAKKIVRDFAVEQAKAVVQLEIDKAEKILKGFEKDQASLEKSKEKLEKDIKGYEGKIEENKASIVENIESQKSKQNEIHKLEKSQIDGHLDEVEKVIKGFEKEMKGMVKDKKQMEEDNEDLSGKIKEAEAEIQQNLKDQKNKKTEIENMKTTVTDLSVKKNAIN